MRLKTKTHAHRKLMCRILDYIKKRTRLLQLQLQERHVLEQLRSLDSKPKRLRPKRPRPKRRRARPKCYVQRRLNVLVLD